MLNAGGNKVIGKSSQRKGKAERGRKAEPRKQAAAEQRVSGALVNRTVNLHRRNATEMHCGD